MINEIILPMDAGLKHQRGFIQNLIIPGILLIGAVIGILSLMTNSSGSGNADKEQASVRAAGILAQGITLKEATQRALADGVQTGDLGGGLSVLTNNGYITGGLPIPPVGSQQTITQWAFVSNYAALDNQSTPAHVSTSANDDVLILASLTKDVCVRINNKLYGESVLKANDAAIGSDMTATTISAPIVPAAYRTGTTEGCVPSVTDGEYTYYKVITAK